MGAFLLPASQIAHHGSQGSPMMHQFIGKELWLRPSASGFSPFFSDRRQCVFNLFFAECLLARSTLISLFHYFVVDQIVRKINPVKTKAKIVNKAKILVPTVIADKKV
jgi:hypothetical protein